MLMGYWQFTKVLAYSMSQPEEPAPEQRFQIALRLLEWNTQYQTQTM